MADASAPHPAPPAATVADVMHPPVTTIEQNDHVAGAAYLMKRAGATALVVTQPQTGEPVGIITEADISHLVADGKNPNDVRIYQLMTARPTVVSTTTSIREAARVMTGGRFRHLPVMAGPGLAGIVDITDICRALLDALQAAQQPPPDPRPPAGRPAPPPAMSILRHRSRVWSLHSPSAQTARRRRHRKHAARQSRCRGLNIEPAAIGEFPDESVRFVLLVSAFWAGPVLC